MFETEHQKNIICPYCGFAHTEDLWEDTKSGKMQCINCDKPFMLTKEVAMVITFSTKKVEK